MKKIFSHQNIMIIHNLKNILENEEIACFLKNEHLAGSYNLNFSYPELWIQDDEDFDKAIDIISKSTK